MNKYKLNAVGKNNIVQVICLDHQNCCPMKYELENRQFL